MKLAGDGTRKGITVSRRIRLAPLPLQTKAGFVVCLVGPASMYGFRAGGHTPRLINSLRTAVVAPLWGAKRRSRCREIVLTLFTKRHLVDLLQNATYQSLRQLRRMAMCDGPVTVIHNILRWMGWHWQPPGLFAREGRPHLRLLDGPESWWLHEIRQGLRKKAGTRRRDVRGIESTAGVDKLATTKTLNSNKLLP